MNNHRIGGLFSVALSVSLHYFSIILTAFELRSALFCGVRTFLIPINWNATAHFPRKYKNSSYLKNKPQPNPPTGAEELNLFFSLPSGEGWGGVGV